MASTSASPSVARASIRRLARRDDAFMLPRPVPDEPAGSSSTRPGDDHADHARPWRAHCRRARGGRPHRGRPAAHRHAPAEVRRRRHDPDGARRGAQRDGRQAQRVRRLRRHRAVLQRTAVRRDARTRSEPCWAPVTRRSASSTTAAGSTTGSRSACHSHPLQSNLHDDLTEHPWGPAQCSRRRAVGRGSRPRARR